MWGRKARQATSPYTGPLIDVVGVLKERLYRFVTGRLRFLMEFVVLPSNLELQLAAIQATADLRSHALPHALSSES
jgi:hypothetical protein